MEGETDKKSQNKSAAELLHSKSPLSSLRTYQGDVASIIKSQHESATSIALKEKEKRERRPEPVVKSKPRTGIMVFVLAVVLLVAGAYSAIFVFNFLKSDNPAPLPDEPKILPSSNSVVLSNVTSHNLGMELGNLSQSGVVLVQISKADGNQITEAKDLFEFVGVSVPSSLLRNLEDDFAMGAIGLSQGKGKFLVLKVKDFETVFGAMLEWESNIAEDLKFLRNESIDFTANSHWKDLIVKNKDVRALSSDAGVVLMAYTFLDKNTVLISGSIEAIPEIVSVYASRSLVR